MNAYLVLGCTGYINQSGFYFCSSTTNIILDLSKVSSAKYDKIIIFLDQTCGLFDQQIYDRNKASNVLQILYRDFDAFPEPVLLEIQGFLRMHRTCGIYLILMPKENYIDVGRK